MDGRDLGRLDGGDQDQSCVGLGLFDAQARRQRRKFLRMSERWFAFYSLDQQPDRLVEAITNNIGAGGVSFDTNRLLPKQSQIWIELYAPLPEQRQMVESIYIKGCVIWQRMLVGKAGNNKFRVGVSFLSGSPEAQDTLRRHCEMYQTA